MDDQSTLLELIGAIYDAVDDPALWDRFLHRFADALHGTVTPLILFNADKRVGCATSFVRVDSAAINDFRDYYINIDPWAMNGRRFIVTGAVNPGQKMCPDSVLKRSEFYNDFSKRLGVFHHLSGVIHVDGSEASVLTTSRAERDGPFDERDQNLLRLLMPHLQRALTLHRRVGALRQKQAWSDEVLDRLPTGMVLFSADEKILYVNASARRILSQNDGLCCQENGIQGLRMGDTRRIQQLLRGAIATQSGSGAQAGGHLLIPRPSGRRSFHLLVSPYRSSSSWPGVATAAATVLITDPELQPTTSVELVTRLYGLTPAEARVASLLSGGLSVTDVADRLEISIHTARVHLKRVFLKTGTRRQSELIRELMTRSLAEAPGASAPPHEH